MIFFRLLAAGLLTLGGWCAGDGLAYRLELRCRTMEQIFLLLQRLQQEIGYRRTDLRQLFCILQQEADPQEEWGRALLSAEGFQALIPPSCLNQTESRFVSECFAGLGHTAAQMECARLDYYIHRCDELLQKVRRQQRQSAGLDRRLGLAIGASLGLLIL